MVLALVVGLAVGHVVEARGQRTGGQIALSAGRLADALRELSVRSGVDLLFSPAVVGDRVSPRVVGAKTVEQALQQLLAGSGLSFRRTDGGAIVIYGEPAPEPVALPELLVVGRKTQNVDIRRTENDIQPYKVLTAPDIAATPADDIDQFLHARLPSDAEPQAPSQNPNLEFASNRSEVDLHGLGPEHTLVLVDGARMPSYVSPLTNRALGQPDINGVPLAAIDRIETLTATAGGIFGPGATGGVVNVVLKRDYSGAEVSATYGVTDRGDAPIRRVDGRIGFSPDHGATDIMIAFSRASIDGIGSSDRGYTVQAQLLEIAQRPVAFQGAIPVVNGLAVFSEDGSDLKLKPAFGGGPLGSVLTYLPIGFSGGDNDIGAQLLTNAGTFPTTPPPHGAGMSLTPTTDVTSLVANVRRKFGDRVEAFIDVIGYRNDGRSVIGGTSVMQMSATAPTNPFEQNVDVTFPRPDDGIALQNRLSTIRVSGGAIVHLPKGWTANANLGWGWTRNVIDLGGSSLSYDAATAVAFGVPGAAGQPAPNPFGDWTRFLADLQGYKVPFVAHGIRDNRFQDESLRLAGSLMTTRTGPVSLSLLAERRREDVPVTSLAQNVLGFAATTQLPAFSQEVWSLYGELRAPIVRRDSGPRLLRGLELQLAGRYDWITTAIPAVQEAEGLTVVGAHASQGAAAYTAGFRVYPLDRLMLRASISTGVLPPTPEQLIQQSVLGFILSDPKRGGESTGDNVPLLMGGSQTLKPARAQTISAGLVLNPDDGNRPRISLDFTHTEIRDQIIGAPSLNYFLRNEDAWPGRIKRAPLTAADRAAGFTGGVVTQIDDTTVNAGFTRTDVVDLGVEQLVPLGSRGSVRLHGLATWQPRLERFSTLGDPAADYVGFADGPLEWRANAGVDWQRGPLGIALNAQYYAAYYATPQAFRSEFRATQADLNQPGVRIPAQVYLDLAAFYRFRLPGGVGPPLEARLRVANLLGYQPPAATDSLYDYSYYGDPRGRRFELTLTGRF
jgi:outer membrane receptor protein involved in Fe transport